MKETNRIEFKRELTNDLEKEVIAFLNYREGGNIYIGIADDGTAVGLDDFDSVQLKIKDRLKTNILPSCLGLFDVIHELYEGKDVININIASGSDKPYYLKKRGMSESGCFLRVGSASEPMSVRQIEDLFAKRTRHSLGKMKSNRQDLTFGQLKIYYEALGFKLNNEFLKSIDLFTPDGKYNYVAYLLADNNSNSFKVAKYAGKNKSELIENEEFGFCSIIKATNSIVDKLNIENKTFVKITGAAERLQKQMINKTALREALINAMVHNDYSSEITPVVEIYADRLAITSYGGLVQGLSKEEFLAGRSMPRNRELMRVFRDLKFVEQLGSGVHRILDAYDENIFKISENFFEVSFVFEKEYDEEKGSVKSDTKVSQVGLVDALAEKRKNFGTITKRINIDSKENVIFLQSSFNFFTEYFWDEFGIASEKLRESFGETSGKNFSKPFSSLMLIVLFPEITAEEIGLILGVSSRSAETYIQKLKQKKLIERLGGKKEGSWQIIKIED